MTTAAPRPAQSPRLTYGQFEASRGYSKYQPPSYSAAGLKSAIETAESDRASTVDYSAYLGQASFKAAVDAAVAEALAKKDKELHSMLSTLERDTAMQTLELRELLAYRAEKCEDLEKEIADLKASYPSAMELEAQNAELRQALSEYDRQNMTQADRINELEVKLKLAEEWATSTRNSCLNEDQITERIALARAEEQAVADERVANMAVVKDDEIERLRKAHAEDRLEGEKAWKRKYDALKEATITIPECDCKTEAAVKEALANHKPGLVEEVEEAVGLFSEEVEETSKGRVLPPGLSRPELKEDLMKAFDEIDEEGAGMAPRLDLRQNVDTFVPAYPEAQELSDTVRGLDAMIVERDEYEELVDEWKAKQ